MIASHLRRSFLMLFGLVVVVVLASCSKKEVGQDEPLISPSGDTGGAAAPLDEGVATDSSGSAGGESFSAGSGDLGTVYFDYDSYQITGSGRDTLSANADWLKSNSAATIQIEGHCDERGTTEYNLALGERRANATRDYLVRLGVDRSRVSVISYGEERPAEAGHDESAWGRNRRSVFVVLSR